MGKYFSAFPITVYANTACIDITTSTRPTKQAIKGSSLYYKTTIEEGTRPDVVSDRMYDNSFYDWVVYFSNGVVDPYYDWPLTTAMLNSYMRDKYGSLARATEKILFYRVNWASDKSRITKSQYNAMSAAARKYWRQETVEEVAYVRKEIDHKVNTNMIVEVEVDTPAAFSKGDYINQTDNGVVTASGEVVFVGSGKINVQHVAGEFVTGSPINNVDTNATANVVEGTSQTLIARSIPQDELVYWEAVNAYDYETEANEAKKNILVLNKRYLRRLEEEHQEKIANG